MIEWFGLKVIETVHAAAGVALRETGRRAVEYAENHHAWESHTGELESDIGVFGVEEKEGEIVLTWGDSAPFALFVEIGTHHAPPFPYLRPAQDQASKELPALLAAEAAKRALAR